MELAVGAAVRVEMSKFDGRRHWTFDGRYLGADAHGDWIGFPTGTHHERPGAAFDSAVDSVTLVPARAAYALVTLQAPGIWCDVYVDMATPATWSLEGDVGVVRSVDLDLDVVRSTDAARTVYVDDEDEFAEHQVAMGYPSALVLAARASCEAVFGAVVAGAAPYDDATAAHWLGVLAGLPG